MCTRAQATWTCEWTNPLNLWPNERNDALCYNCGFSKRGKLPYIRNSSRIFLNDLQLYLRCILYQAFECARVFRFMQHFLFASQTLALAVSFPLFTYFIAAGRFFYTHTVCTFFYSRKKLKNAQLQSLRCAHIYSRESAWKVYCWCPCSTFNFVCTDYTGCSICMACYSERCRRCRQRTTIYVLGYEISFFTSPYRIFGIILGIFRLRTISNFDEPTIMSKCMTDPLYFWRRTCSCWWGISQKSP